MSCAEFFGEISSHPGDTAPLQPRFGALQILFQSVLKKPCLFPKLKSPLKGKRFQPVDKTQENTMGQLMAIQKTVWGPKVPTLKGTEAPLSYVQCFLYLVSSSINASIFHITWLSTFWTDLVCCWIFSSKNMLRFYICSVFCVRLGSPGNRHWD